MTLPHQVIAALRVVLDAVNIFRESQHLFGLGGVEEREYEAVGEA